MKSEPARLTKLAALLALVRAEASTIDANLLIILAMPLLLLFTCHDWVLEYVRIVDSGYIDPWVYLGFFLDLPGRLQLFPSTYYGSRMSWVLPGYLTYKIFPPLVAAYVLHLAFYYAAVFSLYLVLKDTVGRRAALFSAILMGCYSHFLGAVGWDYVDGAGITYFLLTTLALMFGARHQQWWIWLFLAGAFYGAMIYSQLFLLIFTPSLLLYYFLGFRGHRHHSRALALSLFASGFLMISVFLGAINQKLNGDFLFYRASVTFANATVGKPNPYKLPFHMWANQATWLIFPSLAFLSSLVSLSFIGRLRSDRRLRFIVLSQVGFLICALTLLIFQLTGSAVFQFVYYTSLLIPPMFLALGAQFSLVLDRLSPRHFVLLVCAAIGIFLWTYNPFMDPRLVQWVRMNRTNAFFLLLVFVFAGAVLLCVKRLSVTALPMLLVCVAFGLLNATNTAFGEGNPDAKKHGLLAVVQSVRVIQSLDPTGKPLFWYRANEPMGNLFRAVASTYLWAYSLVNERFPALEQGRDSFQSPRSDTRMIILSNDKDVFQKADQEINRAGFGTQFIAERTIQDGPIGWKIVFLEVHNWPIVEGIEVSQEGWPLRAHLRWPSQKQQVVSFVGRDAHRLFRSDMDAVSEWQVNQYGHSGGLKIEPRGLAPDDQCGLYSSGDHRDHLSSPFVERASGGILLFSVWVKALYGGEYPTVSIQDEGFSTVAKGRVLSSRPDGWVLLGGSWSESTKRQKIRLMITQKVNTASLLDKAVVVDFDGQSLLDHN